MKHYLVFILLTSLCMGGFAQNSKKAIFVIVDGISADVIEKLNTPALDAIAREGGYARAHVGGEKGGYSETPTISAVGYNSLLTGTWVNKHNVWDNDIAAPNYNYWTIFRFLEEQYPGKKTAVFSSWEDNRTKLVGENLSATGNIKLDYHFDGLELDTINYPHDKSRDFMHRIDEAVVNNAVEHIKKEAPDLSWVYLEYTDDMGHMYGDSEQFYKAVAMMDDQMGRLWQAIQYRKQNFKEDWVIYITTDHGRDAQSGKHHGGQSDRERSTWIVTNAKGLNNYFKTGNPGVVDIMPSIANFLNISIPRERLMEIDGMPLTGKLYATTADISLLNNKLRITWKALEKKGNAKIWLSTTNHFKEGGKDEYILQATVPLAKQEAIIDVSKLPSSFYKVVIETPGNMLNRWVAERK
ncbi:alkaline phosphatase family protein [Agriterribacter sp.]|uniref:alkaline phosphatase family protein n=1 Tax=Agriterribacter sp. TaxID=2821509 RepID=UPI002C091722|nr:alkaline phosphatase family protein [Agriterribacter sp.]HTN05460.1 alkaline phosphatase family protein [Agriterribacter sp.]